MDPHAPGLHSAHRCGGQQQHFVSGWVDPHGVVLAAEDGDSLRCTVLRASAVSCWHKQQDRGVGVGAFEEASPDGRSSPAAALPRGHMVLAAGPVSGGAGGAPPASVIVTSVDACSDKSGSCGPQHSIHLWRVAVSCRPPVCGALSPGCAPGAFTPAVPEALGLERLAELPLRSDDCGLSGGLLAAACVLAASGYWLALQMEPLRVLLVGFAGVLLAAHGLSPSAAEEGAADTAAVQGLPHTIDIELEGAGYSDVRLLACHGSSTSSGVELALAADGSSSSSTSSSLRPGGRHALLLLRCGQPRATAGACGACQLDTAAAAALPAPGTAACTVPLQLPLNGSATAVAYAVACSDCSLHLLTPGSFQTSASRAPHPAEPTCTLPGPASSLQLLPSTAAWQRSSSDSGDASTSVPQQPGAAAGPQVAALCADAAHSLVLFRVVQAAAALGAPHLVLRPLLVVPGVQALLRVPVGSACWRVLPAQGVAVSAAALAVEVVEPLTHAGPAGARPAAPQRPVWYGRQAQAGLCSDHAAAAAAVAAGVAKEEEEEEGGMQHMCVDSGGDEDGDNAAAAASRQLGQHSALGLTRQGGDVAGDDGGEWPAAVWLGGVLAPQVQLHWPRAGALARLLPARVSVMRLPWTLTLA